MQLSAEERLELMRFLCWFAYADMRLDPQEFNLIDRLAEAMKLSPEQRRQVDDWLEDPPEMTREQVESVPAEKREIFLDALQLLGNADHDIDSQEFALFDRVSQIWSDTN